MHWTTRPFAATDLDRAVAQAVREGWSPSREWFAAVIGHDPELCRIAEADGRPVAMVTATAFAASGWIGNLIVDPGHRRRGLGEELMRRSIAALEARGIRTLRLDADPPGVHIYRRLGFVDEQPSRRFRLEAGAAPPPAGPLSRLASFGAAAALDRRAFGDDRTRLLSILLPRCRAAFAAVAGGAVQGYALAVPSAGGTTLGPCVAPDAGTAVALVAACLGACGGAQVTVGCLEDNPGAVELYRSLGFVETAPSLRMVRGPAAEPGRTAEVWAIANGAVG